MNCLILIIIIGRFIRFITSSLGESIKATRLFNIKYGGYIRQLVTFKKINNVPKIVSESVRNSMVERIHSAYTFANKVYNSGLLPGGVHAVELAVVKELCLHIGIEKSDGFWEIGVGLPLLAFSLSAAAQGGIVIGTDIRKHFISDI